MADSIHVSDTIESSGLPLGFRVRNGTAAHQSAVRGAGPARDVFKVEARALGGHQKEAVVTEGEFGPGWRLVSDEGAFLQGTDLAPFPLGFMNAGIATDVLGRIEALARAEDIHLSRAHCELATDYSFEGSFFKGTGKGSARPPEFKFDLAAPASKIYLEKLVMRAMDASPLIALHRHRQSNSFALHVNGQRQKLRTLPDSDNTDIRDPLKVWSGVPKPLTPNQIGPALIERLAGAPAGGSVAAASSGSVAAASSGSGSAEVAPLPGESAKLDILVRGSSSISNAASRSEVWLGRPIGSHFILLSDESGGDSATSAPSGLSLAMAGIAFCLMTQVLRYVQYHKMKVRALRIVQLSPFEITNAGLARASPLDTHMFVHADESDETMERLLVMAANTCYLHAALADALEPKVTVVASGAV